jgi:hypothetical protein
MKKNPLYEINKNKLNPYFVTGYSDGESSFSVRFIRSNKSKFGFSIIPVYSIGAEANIENLKLLRDLKDFFDGIGSISLCGNMYIYEVSSITTLHIIINHFEKYPFETTKIIHFKLLNEIINMMLNKEHLTEEGFLKILSIKATFPKGLNKNIINAYPNIKPIIKPQFIPKTNKLNPHWIAGFSQADSSFGLNLIKRSNRKLGHQVLPQYRVYQHKRDIIVLKRIILTLNCGILIKPAYNRDEYTISVTNRKDLLEIIIPFFKKHPFYGAKWLDFNCFCQGMEIIKNKDHLKQEGLDRIKELISNMNRQRKF